MNKITYFTQSLKNEERMKIIQKNKLIIPEMKIFKSINGYDEDITIKKLINMYLKYFKLDFETYGTLANFLTKVKAFQYQIKHKIILNEKIWKSFIKNNMYEVILTKFLNDEI